MAPQVFVNRAAEAACQLRLIDGDNRTGLPGGILHGALIERLDGVHVDDACRDALGRQLVVRQ